MTIWWVEKLPGLFAPVTDDVPIATWIFPWKAPKKQVWLWNASGISLRGEFDKVALLKENQLHLVSREHSHWMQRITGSTKIQGGSAGDVDFPRESTRNRESIQCEAPKMAKLVQITPICLWFMVLITIVTGVYKPTYNWGASHCRDFFLVPDQQIQVLMCWMSKKTQMDLFGSFLFRASPNPIVDHIFPLYSYPLVI